MADRIFSRPVPASHPLEAALDHCLLQSVPEMYTALACNLVHDHRVSPERETELMTIFVDDPIPGKGLVKALQKYLDEKIRFRRRPAFLNVQVNSVNLLPNPQQFGLMRAFVPAAQRASQTSPVSKDVWLARILDLNRLAPAFWTARWHRVAAFKTFPRAPRRNSPHQNQYPQEVLRWLDEALAAQDDHEAFVAAVMEALELKRRRKPYQPTWATYWSHFKPLVPEGPGRWAEAVGMPNGRHCAHWFMVLKYPQRAAGLLVRPTILDAGPNPYHFPSPPQAVLELGGHPVDLQLSPRPSILLPEFIHQQIPHTLDHWRAGGALLARTSDHHPRPGWLAKRRGNHYQLLAKIYGPSISDWMSRCI